MLRVDLNSDVGESFGNYKYGNDEENMDYLTSVNMACGLHAGDPMVIRETVAMAHQKGLAIGAHPGLPDIQGFGRRKMDLSPEEARDFVLYQLGALSAFLKIQGAKMTHVTLHGALSGMGKHDDALARAVVEGVKAYDPELIFTGVPGLRSYEVAKEAGLRVAACIPIDLNFRKDGTSIIERKKSGRDPKEVVRKALKLVTEDKLETVDGVDKELKVDILLIHGDGPNSADLLSELRSTLTNSGVKIEPFPNFV
ncbi:LamB/YcsF family protein [Thermodesulfobacteriota bacterium]